MRKKRKKQIVRLFIGLFSIACFSITAYASTTYASVALQPYEKKITTKHIGLAKKVTAEVWNSSKSKAKVTVKIYAAWSGYPFTCEQTNTIAKNGYGKYIEKQKKNSSFKMRLSSGGNVAAVGKIYMKDINK